jgi:hypothetical protein
MRPAGMEPMARICSLRPGPCPALRRASQSSLRTRISYVSISHRMLKVPLFQAGSCQR